MTSKSGGTIYTWGYSYDRYGRLKELTRPDGSVETRTTGREQLGWLSRDGSHLNVSLKGEITHE